MRHGSLFSGIGGFDLAAEWMGWENVFHCEWNPFCQVVLKHYFPNSISYDDIKKTDFTIHRGQIDIITGGFPCQPYSNAGKRKGKADDRHLWPEMLRAIREIQPTWVVGENVRGLLSWDGGLVFREVQSELEAEGYEVLPFLLPAASVGAPHRRDRIWFIAYRNGPEPEHNNRTNNGQERKIWRCKKGYVPGELFSDGIATHTNHTGTGNRSRVNPNRQEENQRRKGQPQPEFREDSISFKNTFSNGRILGELIEKRAGNGKQWHTGTGNTNRVLFEQAITNSKDIGQQPPGRAWKWRTRPQNGNIKNATNTNSKRHEKFNPANFANKSERQYSKTNFRNKSRSWQNFPTQPPVCGRNDGFPGELDSDAIPGQKMTYSKWRQEAIKAYGNAIVPQVVYPIFKAINEINEQETQK